MRDAREVLALEERADGRLGLHGVLLVGPAEPAREPAEVRVDRESRHAERVAEHDVRGLAAHSGEGDEIVETRRHLTVVPFDERLTDADEGACLGALEAGRSDDLLDVGHVGLRVRESVGVCREELGRHLVDADVRRLCGQDRRDEQLERRREVELAACVGVHDAEDAHDPTGAAHERGARDVRVGRRWSHAGILGVVSPESSSRGP